MYLNISRWKNKTKQHKNETKTKQHRNKKQNKQNNKQTNKQKQNTPSHKKTKQTSTTSEYNGKHNIIVACLKHWNIDEKIKAGFGLVWLTSGTAFIAATMLSRMKEKATWSSSSSSGLMAFSTRENLSSHCKTTRMEIITKMASRYYNTINLTWHTLLAASHSDV